MGVNNTHGLADQYTDKSKLIAANNYSHPTQTAIDGNAADDGINVIDRVQVNTLGHRLLEIYQQQQPHLVI